MTRHFVGPALTLSFQGGRKLLVVKRLDTSWHPLQKKPEVPPVSSRFGMDDGRLVAQLLLACLHIWLAAPWLKLRFCASQRFLWHLYEHLLLTSAANPPVLRPASIYQWTPQPAPHLFPTHDSHIQSRSDGATLMENIWSVFRFQLSAKGGAK